MTSVFLDTSYLLALEVANDQYHSAAVEHWSRVQDRGLPGLVTTSGVFTEVVTYLNSRNLHAKAVEVGASLLESPSVQMVHEDEELLADAWQFFIRHADKRYSLTDCASFVLMQRLGLTTAFAFDHHFRQAGFQTQP